MSDEDLVGMLDLGGKPAVPREDGFARAVIGEGKPEALAEASPTALELDAWALRRGRELLAESALLRKLGLGEEAVADFHAAAFLPDPVLVERCRDEARRMFLEAVLGTPEYRALHAATMLKEEASEIAAASFAEQFAALKEKQHKKGCSTSKSGGSGTDAGADAEMAALKAAGKALAKASEEVEALGDAAAALGLGEGAPGGHHDPRRIAELFRQVRNDCALRRICELAGRFRRVAQSVQRRKAGHGSDEVAGVESGGDLARLLPVELARLALPELEMDTLRRLVEKQCQQRELRGRERLGKGPVVACVDESGSMQGEKAHAAKALALAVAWTARRQKRWCALVAYSGDSGERLLALPPGGWDEEKLVEWLRAFIGRGSSIDVPVRELPRMWKELGAPKGRTDVLFLTDAQCVLPVSVKEGFLAWKREAQARLVTLVLQGVPGDLASISDECHRVASLSSTEEGVERALSF